MGVEFGEIVRIQALKDGEYDISIKVEQIKDRIIHLEK